MNEKAYLNSVYRVIEHIIGKELLDTSKRLIANYIEGSREMSLAGKARGAITRYLQADIPTLDELRKKTKVSLNKLDHLVLKMEYEADLLQKNMYL
jgi:hypothetical protein